MAKRTKKTVAAETVAARAVNVPNDRDPGAPTREHTHAGDNAGAPAHNARPRCPYCRADALHAVGPGVVICSHCGTPSVAAGR